ncbi:MAG: 3-dehydroquinate synthase [Bacteroidales bacterium]
MKQQIRFTSDINQEVDHILQQTDFDKLYILTDRHTADACLPLLGKTLAAHPFELITLTPGDDSKDLTAIARVWQILSETGASRHSLLINLGGGMITDLGGFAAASFKRGIRFINIPTSLLGAVDAAVGGKTGINFNGLKNEIGAFAPATAVLISTQFFKTLDHENILSGYAEMLKHGLLSSEDYFNRLLAYNPDSRDFDTLLHLLEESVNIKREVVETDPFEKGIRKALNLGHTVGHAFESYALSEKKPVLHGYAVAWGLVCELILSHRQCGFPQELLLRTAAFVRENYGPFVIGCKQYDRLNEYMTHDKKNDAGFINFTLLKGIGDIAINQSATRENIDVMFDIYRDLMRI